MLSRIILSVLLLMCGCTAESLKSPSIQSGLQPGEDIVPWNPVHLAGPNAGTNACPICTYEARPAIQIFTRDGPNAAALAARLQLLVQQQKDQQLKGFVIVLDSTIDGILKLANDSKIHDIGLCYPDAQTRDHDLKAYKINPAADNTVIVYRNYKVTANFVNLDASDFGRVESAIKSR